MRRPAKLALAAVLALAFPSSAPGESALGPARLLVAAFDTHDAEAMAALVTEDFELYYVGEDGTISLATRGRAELRASMEEYFAARPDVRSEIAGKIEGPRFATFRERVWREGERAKARTSLAVYEVRGDLVARAWYFPAEPDVP